ncbi:MAG: Sensory box/GGDEF family protein [uncultured Sulfurovum sp.]|uniref:Sensory box/GGDEF family protein n=2 Tax=uncultured Sulfurovum sp. TaxID=269237 RepID=A0A6S6T7C5_9BACT|nr:MAG: Sensory box/GGDEF family protein [uncultured Sulfurovum sp.]
MLQSIKLKKGIGKNMNNDLMKIVEETKKLKTLVLEDEPETNELMCTTLKNFFSEVHSATDAASAMQLFEQHSPDIIFIDIILPGKSGLDVAKEIREINPKQIIVIVSASNDMGNISEAVKIGVNNFIRKPIDTDKMIDVLKDIVADIKKQKKNRTKIFSITLPLDLYEQVDQDAKGESISKNAMIIRALKHFYNL